MEILYLYIYFYLRIFTAMKSVITMIIIGIIVIISLNSYYYFHYDYHRNNHILHKTIIILKYYIKSLMQERLVPTISYDSKGNILFNANEYAALKSAVTSVLAGGANVTIAPYNNMLYYGKPIG